MACVAALRLPGWSRPAQHIRTAPAEHAPAQQKGEFTQKIVAVQTDDECHRGFWIMHSVRPAVSGTVVGMRRIVVAFHFFVA